MTMLATIDKTGAAAAEASASADVLFDLGLMSAAGRAGGIDLIAAHKWFNLAAMRGHREAVAQRRDIATLMSDVEIALAQREARAWLTAH
ncbi:MAG: hypothetical protein EPO23_05140 [Xanthobacteraceae bacterium]|nr:MAG: hypothetical protein EPO23_05140 [Xanthobacteraceae bacterium]